MTDEEKKQWTVEAMEALSARAEVDQVLQTTETAAWSAGYVAAWLDLREKLARAARAISMIAEANKAGGN